jgi:hypothetical protein
MGADARLAACLEGRELNCYCTDFNLGYETLKHIRHLERKGEYFVSPNLLNNYYYALGIFEEDCNLYKINYRGELFRLACLPIDWSGLPY